MNAPPCVDDEHCACVSSTLLSVLFKSAKLCWTEERISDHGTKKMLSAVEWNVRASSNFSQKCLTPFSATQCNSTFLNGMHSGEGSLIFNSCNAKFSAKIIIHFFRKLIPLIIFPVIEHRNICKVGIKNGWLRYRVYKCSQRVESTMLSACLVNMLSKRKPQSVHCFI